MNAQLREAEPFDWHSPDYGPIYTERAARLRRIRQQPRLLAPLRAWYSNHVADFIAHWGVTADPRGALLSPPRPVLVPFVLFPRQRELVEWVCARIQARDGGGLVEKSRDCGASWLCMAIAVSLCLLRKNTAVGVGSAKEDLVDRSGDPASLLHKARVFAEHLPPEFRGSWNVQRHSMHMRLLFPETGGSIVGQSGDEIGRGSRTSLFLLDEACHLPRDELVEAALTSSTDCAIWVSSVRGMDNVFARRRHSGKFPVFSFGWRHDPRKDQAWYDRQVAELSPLVLACEVNIDYAASAGENVIPSAWAQAAVGAAEKLGITVSGLKRAALDIADTGADDCAFAGRHGILLRDLKSWSGKDSDIYRSVTRAFGLCDGGGYEDLHYDGDGMGAGVRGDANAINEQRRAAGRPCIREEPFRGSGAVENPTGEMVSGRTNQDYFLNLKAQSWISLRLRFRATYRAVVMGMPIEDPDALISIDPKLPELSELLVELCMPTYSVNAAGKLIIDKLAGGRSPNRADAVMIAFAPVMGNLEAWMRL